MNDNCSGSVLEAQLRASIGVAMHWKRLIEKTFLGAWDLCDDDGKPLGDAVVTIESVQSEKLKTQQTMKSHPDGRARCVIRFRNKSKPLVANTTNCTTIATMYGNEIEGWIGKRVALYVAQTRDPNTGGQVPCIRVRPRPPGADKKDHAGDLNRPVNEWMRRQQDQAFGGGGPIDPEDFQR